MEWFEALILGLIQGLTEFLPVSSSGHIELGKAILGVNVEESIVFSVVVHGATVLSTIVIFYKEIIFLLRGLFRFSWNQETQYMFKIFISMLPVLIIGLFFKEEVEKMFSGNVFFVGSMLIVTSILLFSTYIIKKDKLKIHFFSALIIGIAQAFAVIPGISRSGATIATGLLLGTKRDETTKFSFLMVLLPIIGANIIAVKDIAEIGTNHTGFIPVLIGFLAAFVSGLFACKWMIKIVKRKKLGFFALYCLVAGSVSIVISMFIN